MLTNSYFLVYDPIQKVEDESPKCNGTIGILTWMSDVPEYFNVTYSVNSKCLFIKN